MYKRQFLFRRRPTVWMFLLVSSALCLAGCLTTGVYEISDTYVNVRTSLPPGAPEVSEATVKGSVGWQSSGLFVANGDVLRLTATGTWSYGTARLTGPDGRKAFMGYREVPVGLFNCLLARIGEGYPFLVGSTTIVEVEHDGLLYLRPNECDGTTAGTRGGSLSVKIERYRGRSGDSSERRDDSKSARLAHAPRQQFAVIVGISRYQLGSGLDNLVYADADAWKFKAKLLELGWSPDHVWALVNEEATKRNIEVALESRLTKARKEDQIVLYWSGHGYPDPEDPEKVYFACYDTDMRDPVTGYRMDKVRDALNERGAKNVVVLADTCHAGKLITKGPDDKGVRGIVSYIREKNVPKGWIYMVGTETDRQAIEHSSWANGAFTYCLLNGLSGAADGFQSIGPKDGVVTMGELRAYLESAMPDETQKVLGVAKHPIITTSSGDPDVWNLTLSAP